MTEHDWTRQCALITSLYGEVKLPKVMSIVESQEDFKAMLVANFRLCISLVKSLKVKWGLDKKNKEPEIRAIDHKNKQEAEQGERSHFCVRKRDSNFSEVVRYWKRRGVTVDEFIARSTALSRPETVECSTDVASRTTPLDDLATREYTLRIIRGYVAASFESVTWVMTDPRATCYSITEQNNVNNAARFSNICTLVGESFSTQSLDEAENILSAALPYLGRYFWLRSTILSR